uniref:Rho-GAP domain-containing protein n=1 Tax=Athene cunicularia TaxID=194338 RepID=A0A663M906_ATHCN
MKSPLHGCYGIFMRRKVQEKLGQAVANMLMETSFPTFGIPLFQVIANDRAYKQLQEEVKKSRRLCLEVEATVTRFQAQRQKSNDSVLGPCGVVSATLQIASAPSQGAMSVDSITDLSDNTSKLLEALQLSHPHELDPWRTLGKKKMLSLNPITWQVPRIVERCCKHIETHGLQTVGIFRVGSSKKRVQQKMSHHPLDGTSEPLWAPFTSQQLLLAPWPILWAAAGSWALACLLWGCPGSGGHWE